MAPADDGTRRVRPRPIAPPTEPRAADRRSVLKALTSGATGAVVEDTPVRLGNTAIQFAAIFIAAYAAFRLSDRWSSWTTAGVAAAPVSPFHLADAVGIVTVVVSLILFASRRSAWLTARRAADLALVYEVVVALAIGMAEQWKPYPPGFMPRGISWACVFIAVYPMVLPAGGMRGLVTAFLAASTGPLALLLAVTVGGAPRPSNGALLMLFLPNYLAAAVAAFPARALLKLRRDVMAAAMGSYRLVEKLGHGGMGEVWRAEHRLLARPAAIKLIKPEKLGGGRGSQAEELLHRFEREAQAIAALRSPHTIQLFDFGVTEDRALYYVMELLDGLDLESCVERFGPMPAERCVHILRQVCHSLAEAHRAGLVHRDVKPANVYLCRAGLDHDVVKVLDFGLVTRGVSQGTGDTAEVAWTAVGVDARLTQEGVAAGTPAYMAPEVALGRLDIDARADLYGVGCVGYWLLTGRLLFERDDPIQMMLAHLKDVPEPPSQRTELPVPAALDLALMACLAKKPADRPRDAVALSHLLEAVPLERPWTPELAQRWWSGHRPAAPERS